MAKRDLPPELSAALRLAWALAARLGHACVGTEHLLLALAMQPQGADGRLLHWAGLTGPEIAAAVLRLHGRGAPSDVLPQGLTQAARRAVSRALNGPERLLTALLRESGCSAVRLLEHCGICPQQLFTQLCEGELARKERSMQNTRLLDQFGVDMLERAGKQEPVIGRRQEIETVLQILSRRHKNNPALIGEPGVGKTAIVEGVAQYLAAGTVPEPLRGKRLYALDMASVIAGTKYRGEFEERVRDILAEVRRVQNVILFVDEMHTLVGAGAAEGAIDAANLLKPALGRGELQLIGATTLREYRSSIEKDAALERRFRAVQVREPTPEETREILAGLCPGLEAHHHVSIPQEAVSAAVELSCRYLTDKFLPDKAVDLLDEGAACARMRQLGSRTPEEEQALQAAVRAGKYERAAALRDRLEQFLRGVQKEYGYQQVITPHIGNKELYVTSGHYAKYGKDSFQPIHTPIEGEEYLLKPMNCPHHCEIYRSKPRSYKELPVRLAEFGTVYRYEQSGELHGLTRVRGFTQDDAHLFVRPDQLLEEFERVIDIVLYIFKTLKFDNYTAQISLRDPNNKEKYIGSDENWEKAESAIMQAAKEKGLTTVVELGEAAFYGPKLDFMVKDAIGRKWQLGTIQVDYNLPERFDLTYKGADDRLHRPIMIHRAPFGSMERFVAVLLEHTGGKFPLWLSPQQVVVLPISEKFNDYAQKVSEFLNRSDVRTEVDDRNEKIGRKIRDNELKRIPYLLIVGEKEEAEGLVSVRAQGEGDKGQMSLEAFRDFIAGLVKEEIEANKLEKK